ncbi:MAG: pyridoxal phosphate-dependent aminotransferase [candidate division Zixibacteria bacterium]|nr:pyridoxal phosphate-dependent aminotransferase [candidate division Zixibacteria bacterium]
MQYSNAISRMAGEGAFEVLAKCKQMEAEGRSIIHLQIGEPDFETPKNIRDATIKAINDGQTHYSPSGGVINARKVVAEYMSKTRNIDIGPQHVIIMPGVKPIIFTSMMSIVNPGDEVIVPNPGYPTYESVSNFIGAKPVPMHLREDKDFRFSTDELKELVNPKTSMLVINSPQNPTGGVLTKEDLQTIYELAEEYDFWVLSDEIYSRIIYDTPFESIGSIPGALKRSILIDGMSKTYAMTGWRLGFAVVPEKLAEHLVTFAINNFSCTSTFAQSGIIEGLTGPQGDVDKMTSNFRKRREAIVNGLNSIDGVSCLMPKGAFYAFPNITDTGFTSKELADKLLEESGVACLSGTCFGEYGEGYLRFSYANSVENIQEALRRMNELLVKERA